MIEYPKFETKAEFQKHMYENRNKYFDEKMEKGKVTDPKTATLVVPKYVKSDADKSENKEPVIVKATTEELMAVDAMRGKLAINTTNYFDSHYDVHIPGIWKDDLARAKERLLLQVHGRNFESVIAGNDKVKFSAKNYQWNDLGFAFDGKTQVLQADAIIEQARNPYMYEQYARGFVTQHSVGMRYVQLVMAINNEKYGAEYEAWEKYFPMIVNKEEAEESGVFWAVKEARFSEGSAVPIGSNPATPVISLMPGTRKESEVEPKNTIEIINTFNLKNYIQS